MVKMPILGIDFLATDMTAPTVALVNLPAADVLCPWRVLPCTSSGFAIGMICAVGLTIGLSLFVIAGVVKTTMF